MFYENKVFNCFCYFDVIFLKFDYIVHAVCNMISQTHFYDVSLYISMQYTICQREMQFLILEAIAKYVFYVLITAKFKKM